MRSVTLLVTALMFAGCASKSSDIAPSYFSPVMYQNFTCQQIAQEAQNILRTLLGWPALRIKSGPTIRSQLALATEQLWRLRSNSSLRNARHELVSARVCRP